jgi:hypothetical protein
MGHQRLSKVRATGHAERVAMTYEQKKQLLHEAVALKVPIVLDAIADVVLRYRPKPKSEPAKQRRKKRRKLEKEK